MLPRRTVAYVEVCVHQHSTLDDTVIRQRVLDHIVVLRSRLALPCQGRLPLDTDQFLRENVLHASLTEHVGNAMDPDVEFIISVYSLNEEPPAEEVEETENFAAYQHWMLPSKDYEGLWESLVYEDDVKNRLLNYATTAMLFSDRGVNANLVTWNRVILMHGPPGTGKTSLCKALAQKLSIRLRHRHPLGQLVEINAHSIFSKWFSESGKLVMKLFAKIKELVDDPEAFVCVLLDEVESLTSARKSALNGSEPSDAIRVVNAVLTQLDQLKHYPNVLMLTTSNITEAIDGAFVDRADLKIYIGHPTVAGRYQILASALYELVRTGIIVQRNQLLDFGIVSLLLDSPAGEAVRESQLLFAVAKLAEGLSGRALRKLPFIAFSTLSGGMGVLTLEELLCGLRDTVIMQLRTKGPSTI